MISRQSICGALAALVAALFFAAPAAAEAEFPAARLEQRWQVDLTDAAGQTLESSGLRLRVHDDGRIAFGVGVSGGPKTARDGGPHTLLVTLDADGKILHRAPVRGPRGAYDVIPLSDGDFLLHSATETAVQLRRHGADGRLRFATAMPLGAGNPAGALHDATLRADGRLIAMGSVGLGPNDTIMLAAFDAAGRRTWNYRARLVGLGSEFYTRLYRLAPAGGRERFAILGDGQATGESDRPYFVKPVALDDRAAMKAAPTVLGREGEMRCSDMAADGGAVVGTVPPEPKSLTIRWFDAARAPAGAYTFDRVGTCRIVLDREGRALVWIAPRSVAAFGPKGTPLWRAELSADAAAAAWMPDGGIVAVHPSGAKLTVVRYAPAP